MKIEEDVKEREEGMYLRARKERRVLSVRAAKPLM